MNRRPIHRNTSDSEGTFVDYMLNDLPKYVSSKINCINIGKVTSKNDSRHECNVQLLPLQLDGQKAPVISRAIVPASIWYQDEINKKMARKLEIEYKTLFKVGSVVAIGFFDREIDNWSGSKNYKIESDRMHSLNDPVILGVIKQ